MGFIECVLRKFDHLIKQLIRNSFADSSFYTSINVSSFVSGDKSFPFMLKLIKFLFRHKPSYIIRLRKAKTSQLLHNFHYLFLINNTPIGFSEYRFKFWTIIFNFLWIHLILNILRNKIHWTRTIKRYKGNEIF